MAVLETKIEIAPIELDRTANGRFFILPGEIHPDELPTLSALNLSSQNAERLAQMAKLRDEYMFFASFEDRELSAEDAVSKHMAGTAFGRLLGPMMRDRTDMVIPDGLYHMGDHAYLRHSSGLYVWGPNWYGLECFRVVESTSTFQAVQAGVNARMDTAADMLKVLQPNLT